MGKCPLARNLAALMVMTPAILSAGVGCKGTEGRDVTKLVEFRSYTLRPGVRPAFHRRFVEQSLPMLERWNIDAVAYGPSPQDENSYFLLRAYPGLQDRERSENAFYASNEWRNGPREAVLADIESYTTFVLTLDAATLESLRTAGHKQLSTMEARMQRNDEAATLTDRERLLKLNEDYIASYLSSDAKWYREHLAEDFVCIESDGSVLDKAAFLVDCSKGPDVASYNLAETTIRLYGDTALVQARAVFTRRDGSRGTSRYTDVWVRTPANQWKTVSAQITRSAQ
jgi:ketosteroid isomerase-like protein